MTVGSYCAIYDFELMPYALGDVLTWNVQTAIRCKNLGRKQVDVYICMDERYPASIYQRGTISADNCALFFNELFAAFGTHPKLGEIFVYRHRETMLEQLYEVSKADPASAAALADYECALANRNNESALIDYFTKYIYYHEGINAFAKKHEGIPLLRPSLGCGPDVNGLINKCLAGKKIVAIHMRLRRLDAGYGGEHTYTRDSDFLEWYEFLREAGEKYPAVQFVAMGRLQEKPLELLRLPNVMSLRMIGLGLGHELTLMLRSDLFIGTSSGFAAMANFSEIPYFITKMNRESCNAYRIEPGCERLPFAKERQILVYEPETRGLLMRLLEQGLTGKLRDSTADTPALDPTIDVRGWEWERSQWLHPHATTSRFFIDDTYSDKETAFLLWPKIEAARTALNEGAAEQARIILKRISTNFPRTCRKFPEFLQLWMKVASPGTEQESANDTGVTPEKPEAPGKQRMRMTKKLKRYLRWGYPMARKMKHIWSRRHRIPRKLIEKLRGAAARRGQS